MNVLHFKGVLWGGIYRIKGGLYVTWVLIGGVSIVWLVLLTRMAGNFFAARARSSAVLVHTVYVDPVLVPEDKKVVFRAARSRRWTDSEGVTVYREAPPLSTMSLPAHVLLDHVSSANELASTVTLISPAYPELDDVFRCEIEFLGDQEPIRLLVDWEDISFSFKS